VPDRDRSTGNLQLATTARRLKFRHTCGEGWGWAHAWGVRVWVQDRRPALGQVQSSPIGRISPPTAIANPNYVDDWR
jgi:hypothetical protein